MTGIRLGVDFGTSNTAAVLRWPDGTTKPLLFDGSELLPSAVCRAADGDLLAGRDAVRAARSDPSAFEPHPKRCIDDGTVVLGGRELPVRSLVAAVLRRAVEEAGRVAGEQPAEVVLTCPAHWGPRRRAVLVDAAVEADAHRVRIVAEPVAAAHAYGRLPEGGTLLVYDLGAGTFDASVVRRTGPGRDYEVLAQAGLDDAGGLEVDAAIVAYLGTVYAARDAATWRRLTHPVTAEDRTAARQLWDDARAAKEALSRTATTVVHVPLFGDDAPLGREQLDQLAGPIVDRTVHQTRAVLREAGVAPDALSAVLLVGGASRLPLVAAVLHRRLGVAPTSVERPELLVAEGSTLVPLPGPDNPDEPPSSMARDDPPASADKAPSGVRPPSRAAPAVPLRKPLKVRKPRRSPVILLALLVAAGATVYADTRWFGGAVFGIGDCLEVSLVSSDEKADTLRGLSERFRKDGPEIDGQCVDMRVSVAGSRMVADALAGDAEWDERRLGPRPDVWSPSSSVWTERLRASKHGDRLAAELPSVTRTPVVIGMPRPMAEALGWPAAKIGWSDLAALAADPRGWGARGHPEWGAFKVGKTNPNTSTTGLLSFTSTATAIGIDGVRALELAAVHYGSSVSTFTKNLYRADQEGRGVDYVSAIGLEEQVIFQYNRGNLLDGGQQAPPRTPLVAIYPADGAISSDNPYAVLRAPWVSAAQARAAEAFLQYTREHAQAFHAAGFRDAEDHAGAELRADPNLQAEPIYVNVKPPDTAKVAELLALWGGVRKPASVLVVIDESGSMASGTDAGKTRLQLAREAALPAVDSLAATDELGLWSFSSPDAAGAAPWRELLPLRKVGPETAERYRQSVGRLSPHGETALYATIRAAVRQLKDVQHDQRIYAVVVLSDGANEYSDDDLDGLLAELDRGSLEKPVRVFTIAYGGDADAGALDRIARSARGASYDARNAVDIKDVFNDVLSNF
ncbi:Hsp70 family protein [Dactylosporangium sp. NPDC005572]|uniref:Hsp70 family protein n=1 Tax=Dactylosporangium sp. NPDC005572 TaxID=3156889 RepID=UPI0033A47006